MSVTKPRMYRFLVICNHFLGNNTFGSSKLVLHAETVTHY